MRIDVTQISCRMDPTSATRISILIFPNRLDCLESKLLLSSYTIMLMIIDVEDNRISSRRSLGIDRQEILTRDLARPATSIVPDVASSR